MRAAREKTLWSDIDQGEKPVFIYGKQRIRGSGNHCAGDTAVIGRWDALCGYGDFVPHPYAFADIGRKLRHAIPYRIYGVLASMNKEIKDMVAYLNIIIIANWAADLCCYVSSIRLKGRSAPQKVDALCAGGGIQRNFHFGSNAECKCFTLRIKRYKKANEFYGMYERLNEGCTELTVHEVLERAYEVSGYKKCWRRADT